MLFEFLFNRNHYDAILHFEAQNQELGPGKIGPGYNFELSVYIFDKNLNSEVGLGRSDLDKFKL